MIQEISKPWTKCYGDVKGSLEYSQLSMAQEFLKVAENNHDIIAYEFMGKKTTYKKAAEDVIKCAKALKACGIKENDKITICLPNCPAAISMFYGVNLIGAIANMIHPLSSENEIKFYIEDSKSVAVITLDQFYGKFEEVRRTTNIPQLIIGSVSDGLSALKKIGYQATSGRKIKKVKETCDIANWKNFLNQGKYYVGPYNVNRKPEDPAVILYSGGTTGTNKGILLSNLNFNALATQIIEMSNCFNVGDKMLAAMPMFHGFGFGVCIHTMLVNGGTCLLVPRFTVKSYAQIIKKSKPNLIAGVPTLYEALLRNDYLKKCDLSFLHGIFVGGDSLTVELKKRLDDYLHDHNCSASAREGYGTTECVTASCLTPYNMYKEGSIGIPLPDMYYKIVETGTQTEVPLGTEGEICLAGPTVMIGYVNNEEETKVTKQLHQDGRYWIHTGDLGTMDNDGFIYFKQRIKRMIISSGYNIYPSTIENVLDSHPSIHLSCVIGVRDSYKMQKVKAFVVLKPGFNKNEKTKNEIMAYLKKNVAKYALPYDIEFRDELPKTVVGKVAYRLLEEEENKKLQLATQN
ncbi:MAG: AMP-binding protein [Erysipelotrichaceae bacterium]